MQAWGVFLLLAAVYRCGRCPSFGPGDSPRAVYKALREPGLDPLARLGALAAKLPFDEPMGQVNALSGLLHAAAAALLFASLRLAGAGPVPALTAACLLAFSRRFWYYALVAGRGPAAVLGLAMAFWGVLSGFVPAAALGLALLAGYAPRADSPAPLVLWGLAFASGLLLRHLDAWPPVYGLAALAASVAPALLRPYSARRHNPTLIYAQTMLRGLPPGARVLVADPAIEHAAKLVAEPGIEVSRTDAGATFAEAVLPGGGAPRGLLVPLREAAPPDGTEVARRAEEVLGLPALSSVGLRDLRRYGFTRESILYDRYHAVLTRYLQALGPGQEALGARIRAQLDEYAPGRTSHSRPY